MEKQGDAFVIKPCSPDCRYFQFAIEQTKRVGKPLMTVSSEELKKCIVCKEAIVHSKYMFTCSDLCHEKFVVDCENRFGVEKRVTDFETKISYRVPIRDIIDAGLKYEDLAKYPLW
jgi:predicted nucleic acid-binding Zn ribbon protein